MPADLILIVVYNMKLIVFSLGVKHTLLVCNVTFENMSFTHFNYGNATNFI